MLVLFKLGRAAVTALSKRHADGLLPVEDFDLELEDQSGQKLQFSESDQQYATYEACACDFVDFIYMWYNYLYFLGG